MALLAVLLVWKGMMHAEISDLHDFLALPVPAPAQQWWMFAGQLASLVILGVAWLLWRRKT